MNKISIRIAAFLFLVMGTAAFGQGNYFNSGEDQVSKNLSGFVRGGFYGNFKDSDNKLSIPSSFSDFALKADIRDGAHFKGLQI